MEAVGVAAHSVFTSLKFGAALAQEAVLAKPPRDDIHLSIRRDEVPKFAFAQMVHLMPTHRERCWSLGVNSAAI